MKEFVYFENKETGEMEKYYKLYYVDEIGFEYIKSTDKDYEGFYTCGGKKMKTDYFLIKER